MPPWIRLLDWPDDAAWSDGLLRRAEGGPDAEGEDIPWLRLPEALRALPEADCWELACAFAEHARHVWRSRYPDDDSPQRVIDWRRSALAGDACPERHTEAKEAACRMIAQAVRDVGCLAFAGAVLACASSRRSAADCAWSAALHALRAIRWDPNPPRPRVDPGFLALLECRWQVRQVRERLANASESRRP